SEYEGKVYDDSWHKYDIKSVESVKTEFVTDNATNNAELYKCNFTYITSDGKLEKAELAMIINLDSGDKSLAGTYENFAGSTRYTRFVGLYQETELESEEESSNNEYNISGTYYEANAVGDQPAFTFSAENKVTYGSLWMCSGTYTINKNIIKINLVSAVDPDGREAKCADFHVEENMELTIIDDNTLKDNSNEFIYRKR
ncbi:MAG: hypothetical protein J6J60_01575, partial [Clostridia bacterium]|nr:hypothetical protein [Clostridia bacterium]